MVGDNYQDPRFDADPKRAVGFDMSAMKGEVYGEAIIDIAKPETVISNPVIIKVCESTKLLRYPANEPFTPLMHVGHIRPGRPTPSAQFPILLLPSLHHNKTHKDSHIRAIL